MTRNLGPILSVVKPDSFSPSLIDPVKRSETSEMGVFSVLKDGIDRLLNDGIGAKSPRFSNRSSFSVYRFFSPSSKRETNDFTNGLRVFNRSALIAPKIALEIAIQGGAN